MTTRKSRFAAVLLGTAFIGLPPQLASAAEC